MYFDHLCFQFCKIILIVTKTFNLNFSFGKLMFAFSFEHVIVEL